MKIKDYLVLFRAKHYIKNLLIFVPFLFPAVILSVQNLIISAAGFVTFCFLSSAAYIINDIFDCENDKKHSGRSSRPLASGKITKRGCLLLFAVFLAVSGFLAFLTDIKCGTFSLPVPGIFLLLNLIYSFFAKRIPFFEMLFIPLGFAMRLIYGFVILGSLPDHRLCIFIFVSALYFVLQKRISEITLFGCESRAVLRYYNAGILRALKYVCLCFTLVFFAIMHISADVSHPLIQRIISAILLFVLFLRFEIKAAKAESENTIELVFSDIVMCVLGALFVLSMVNFGLLRP